MESICPSEAHLNRAGDEIDPDLSYCTGASDGINSYRRLVWYSLKYSR